MSSLNSCQRKLLAGFCSDMAKGLLLAGVSTPFVSRETLIYRAVLTILNLILAIIFLLFAINLLKGVKE